MTSKAEVEEALKLWGTHGDGKWKKMLLDQGFHCRCEPAIHAYPPAGL